MNKKKVLVISLFVFVFSLIWIGNQKHIQSPVFNKNIPNKPIIISANERVLKNKTSDFQEKTDHLLGELDKYRLGDQKKFKQALWELLEFDEYNHEALWEYSELLQKEGNTRESIKYSRKCLESNPSHRLCRISLISSLTKENNYKKAKEELIACLNDEPDDTFCLESLAVLYLSDIELEDTLTIIERLDLIKNDTWSTHWIKGKYFLKRGEEQLALKHFGISCLKKSFDFSCDMVKELKKKGITI